MKKFFAAMLVALCCVCSRADTNDVMTALESLGNTLSAIRSELSYIGGQLTGDSPNGNGVWDWLVIIDSDISVMSSDVNTISRRIDSIPQNVADIEWAANQINDKLGAIKSTLQSFNSATNDVAAIHRLLQTVNTNVGSCKSSLLALVQYVSDIRNYTSSLPNIEAYQSALSVIVSNINEHILAGINVSIPNTINVDVRNFPNFNPEWDYLSKTFQWSGQNFDSAWQEFFNPNSQDNTVQQASPMSTSATTTLAEYLEKLYTGINNSGRIINDSIIHACYLLEGSNAVSQAEQDAASDSFSDSVDSADTKMEQIASSIPTPVIGVNTSYISRGISFWDQIGNIQKPPYIVITTSPTEGFLSIPEIHVEVELAKYPALDKSLEFARSVFTWLWWVLSVFFLLWLFRRAMVLYSMVMSLLGPQPAQTTAVDAV